ncbi:MAG: trehalose-phosphatase [Vampirovibrio sp.]
MKHNTLTSCSKTIEALSTKLIQQVDAGKTLALMLDYDGTLTPIVSRPQDAQLDEAGLRCLQRLIKHPQIRVALISGRSVEQLQHFIQSISPLPMLLAGLHGGQVYNAQTQAFLQAPSPSLMALKDSFLEQLQAALSTEAHSLPEGLLIEEKGYSFALHYRLASAPIGQEAVAVFKDIFESDLLLKEAFRLQAGHAVIEVVPKAFNKGGGVRFCMNYWQQASPDLAFVPLFAGDDQTDEVGLKAVLDLNGVGVAVQVAPDQMTQLTPEEQSTLYALESPSEVQAVLQGLCEGLNVLNV